VPGGYTDACPLTETPLLCVTLVDVQIVLVPDDAQADQTEVNVNPQPLPGVIVLLHADTVIESRNCEMVHDVHGSPVVLQDVGVGETCPGQELAGAVGL
jgi:hypothetical protein